MTEEKLKERKERVKKMMPILRKLFPEAKIALRYDSPWELVVAVILSAQCTDKKVNEVTNDLFKKYQTLDAYVMATQGEFEADIRPTGFYRNKAKHILNTARIIKERYNGRVPSTMSELLALPGIARKTANVVLGNAYGVVEGIAVDTHVIRLSRKFDLTDERTPEKIERDLMAIVPQKDWFDLTYLIIEYGRNYSPARKKDCKGEPLEEICLKEEKGMN